MQQCTVSMNKNVLINRLSLEEEQDKVMSRSMIFNFVSRHDNLGSFLCICKYFLNGFLDI